MSNVKPFQYLGYSGPLIIVSLQFKTGSSALDVGPLRSTRDSLDTTIVGSAEECESPLTTSEMHSPLADVLTDIREADDVDFEFISSSSQVCLVWCFEWKVPSSVSPSPAPEANCRSRAATSL